MSESSSVAFNVVVGSVILCLSSGLSVCVCVCFCSMCFRFHSMGFVRRRENDVLCHGVQ